jgi:uncharacterized repeat protein (TIGR03803 family)
MKHNRNSFVLLTMVGALLLPSKASAGERVLYSFNRNGTDGYAPYAGLISDLGGNLYGMTALGGAYGNGAVFKLTRSSNGQWTEILLHSFNGGDGNYPLASLIFDLSGNLYGTTGQGGAYGNGTVFQLTSSSNGQWTETVLYSFNSRPDGSLPDGRLIFGGAGNLYGTTSNGGARAAGTVFKLTPNSNGQWTETVLYSFQGEGGDGGIPLAGLIFDGAGNLYGTTNGGGVYGAGTVFQLTPSGTETVLHSFFNDGEDGFLPYYVDLTFDLRGNLYGTTEKGGVYGNGTLFELTPSSNGQWTETVLHSFSGLDGSNPMAGLIFDLKDNLYGTTAQGGAYGYGAVFKLTPNSNGQWSETVLQSFVNDGHDGLIPFASLIFDAAGNLYGTTFDGGGGVAGVGAVFEILADNTPPTTTANPLPVPNSYGWNNTNVTVTLDATDNPGGSGVEEIQFGLGGAQNTGVQTVAGNTASVTISAEGTTVLTYLATDNAGNQETAKTVSVRIDRTPPVISGLPAPGCTIWPPNHKLVQVAAVTAADALSGLAPGSFTVTGTSNDPADGQIVIAGGPSQFLVQFGADKGEVYTLTAMATDLAGNTATQQATCTVPHDQGN